MCVDKLSYPALAIDTDRLAQLQKWAAIAPQSDEEDLYLLNELNHQLQDMVIKVLDPQLDALIDQVEPTNYGIDIAPSGAKMRDDIVEAWPSPEKLVAQAPRSMDGYFIVPASRHDSLS